MEPRHGREVGVLHAEYIENSLLSDLGVEVLGPLYETLMDSGYGVGFVLTVDGRVAGFSFGRYSHTLSITRAVLKKWRRMAPPLVSFLFRHPLAVPKILKRLTQTGHVECEVGVGELLTIVIAKGVRGGQPSVRIAELLFEKLKSEGCRSVRWETMDDNVRARKFYEKIRGHAIWDSVVSGEKVLWFERDLTS